MGSAHETEKIGFFRAFGERWVATLRFQMRRFLRRQRQRPGFQESEPGSPIALPLDELEPVDMALRRTVALGLGYGRFHSRSV